VQPKKKDNKDWKIGGNWKNNDRKNSEKSYSVSKKRSYRKSNFSDKFEGIWENHCRLIKTWSMKSSETIPLGADNYCRSFMQRSNYDETPCCTCCQDKEPVRPADSC
jgi:hypothetical protein